MGTISGESRIESRGLLELNKQSNTRRFARLIICNKIDLRFASLDRKRKGYTYICSSEGRQAPTRFTHWYLERHRESPNEQEQPGTPRTVKQRLHLARLW